MGCLLVCAIMTSNQSHKKPKDRDIPIFQGWFFFERVKIQ